MKNFHFYDNIFFEINYSVSYPLSYTVCHIYLWNCEHPSSIMTLSQVISIKLQSQIHTSCNVSKLLWKPIISVPPTCIYWLFSSLSWYSDYKRWKISFKRGAVELQMFWIFAVIPSMKLQIIFSSFKGNYLSLSIIHSYKTLQDHKIMGSNHIVAVKNLLCKY